MLCFVQFNMLFDSAESEGQQWMRIFLILYDTAWAGHDETDFMQILCAHQSDYNDYNLS